ncbi:MAG TPA: TetR/AcrR family transcriptional regulator [Planctomycetota bacterium]|nr:TetR/AcrR family transcriptional regulator [Planctomycetota bacterium]
MSRKRLSGKKRREEIIEAARRIFAENGFHGTTTRELAGAAGVSEALLFKHFPSKSAIYKAMLSDCQKSEAWSEAYKLLELEPSTSTLAVMLHFIANKVLHDDAEMRSTHRLMLRSLSEDGDFARVLLKHVGKEWVAKMNACVQSAFRAGDLSAPATKLKDAGWFAQHIMLALSFVHTPAKAAVRYGVGRKALIEEAVVFCLRGLGFSDEAIKTHYNPRAFDLLAMA